MRFLDNWMQSRARALARRTSRRSFLTRLGLVLAGASVIPLLPVARAADGPPDDALIAGDEGDPSKCDYWRNCAIDGFLCTCCGGSHTSCPPGTERSAMAWIGTCRNPADNRDYIISYNDCCGKSTCNRCMCQGDGAVMPNYYPARSPNINWCLENRVYHCTTTLLLGVAPSQKSK